MKFNSFSPRASSQFAVTGWLVLKRTLPPASEYYCESVPRFLLLHPHHGCENSQRNSSHARSPNWRSLSSIGSAWRRSSRALHSPKSWRCRQPTDFAELVPCSLSLLPSCSVLQGKHSLLTS